MRRIPPAVNVALFLLTAGSTTLAGAVGAPASSTLPELLRAGAPYAAALLSILLCHEMGHYLAARRHRVDATLPYFIPLPPPFLVGTLGAFIRIRSAMPTRRAVLDIGAAGPIAGFLVATPLLFYGFAVSPVVSVPEPAAAAMSRWQSPLAALVAWLSGDSPAEASGMLVFGDSLITLLAARLTHGPLPPGHDLSIGPVALAAWFGMFVTALNLIPFGQLDGGHVIYALLGRRAERVFRAISWALLALGLVASTTWLVWWGLTRFVLGPRHPPALIEEPLTPGRRAVAIASLVILALTFVPFPVRLV